ncbi:MAG: hypothetical protein R3252_00090 [Robiginitalea sp.]|nr:hypothetical protein [Robiginitalea sp.]
MTTQLFEQTFMRTHELEIGTFRFYEDIVIGEIREGKQVSLDNSLPLFALAWEQYRNKSVVYISDRKNSYSLDPTMHFETKKLVPFIAGYGWVVYNPVAERAARLEERFLDFPTAVFRSMDPALEWAWDLLRKKQQA